MQKIFQISKILYCEIINRQNRREISTGAAENKQLHEEKKTKYSFEEEEGRC